MIRVKRKLNSTDVVDALTDLFILRGPPEFIRSDNGAEFIAKKVQAWIGAVGAKRHSLRQITVGERLLREFQRPVPGRNAQRRSLPHPARGTDPDRKVATALQHRQAPQRSELPATGPRDLRANGPQADNALTFKPDHSVGAFQSMLRLCRTKFDTTARAEPDHPDEA